MKHPNSGVAAGLVIAVTLLLVIAACGGEQTVASKSAAAFREAQKKGLPTGGDGHGGHSAGGTDPGATTSGEHATMTGMDHLTMPGAAESTMTGMDPSMMPNQSMAGMNHSQMKPDPSMPGMDHSQMQSGQQPMPALDHNSMPGMEHGTAAPRSVVLSAPTTSSDMQRLHPDEILRADSFDAPAPISVSEAMKASAGGGHEMHGMPGQNQASPSTPAPAATVYTCPMHPEFTSDKPGPCPKCGMTMVKKN